MPTGFESFVFFAGKYLVECVSGLENSISDFIGTNLFLLVFFHSYNFHFGIFLDPQDRQLDLKRNCKVDADRVCNFSFRILLVLKISGLGFVGSKNSEFVFDSDEPQFGFYVLPEMSVCVFVCSVRFHVCVLLGPTIFTLEFICSYIFFGIFYWSLTFPKWVSSGQKQEILNLLGLT